VTEGLASPNLDEVLVLLDVRHPLAYLALQPTIALAGSLDVPFDWLPLSTPALKPPTEPGANDDRGIRHRRYRAQAIAREIEVYGAAQGLVLREPYRDGDARAANLAWLYVREQQGDRLEPFLQVLFGAYWSLRCDVSRPSEVSGLVREAGADAEGYLAWVKGEGSAAADRVERELRERGLFQVPAYAVGDEVFYGRQHLPMIRWILGGRVGPGPI